MSANNYVGWVSVTLGLIWCVYAQLFLFNDFTILFLGCFSQLRHLTLFLELLLGVFYELLAQNDQVEVFSSDEVKHLVAVEVCVNKLLEHLFDIQIVLWRDATKDFLFDLFNFVFEFSVFSGGLIAENYELALKKALV